MNVRIGDKQVNAMTNAELLAWMQDVKGGYKLRAKTARIWSDNHTSLMLWIDAEVERALYISLRARAEAGEGNHTEANRLRAEYDAIYDGIFAALDASEAVQP